MTLTKDPRPESWGAPGGYPDIRTTFIIYGDVVTDEMANASTKVAQLAFRAKGATTQWNEA